MRIISFNVNGIRAIREYYEALGNSFDLFLASFNADIICFQEHKTNIVQKLDHEFLFPENFYAYYAFPRNPRKIGYSGVVTFVRKEIPLLTVERGFTGSHSEGDRICNESYDLLYKIYSLDELSELDGEARCIITDHGLFLLMNVYFPNDSGVQRDLYRNSFYDALRLRCLGLKKAGYSIILAGDINATAHPIDHCDYVHQFNKWVEDLNEHTLEKINTANKLINNYIQNELTANMPEFITEFYAVYSRQWLYNLIHSDGFIDAFRLLHPESQFAYTCWNQKIGGRGVNYGTRIDGFWLCGNLWNFHANDYSSKVIVDCGYLKDILGSDHCPVFLDLDKDYVIDDSLVGVTYYDPTPVSTKRQLKLTSFFSIQKDGETVASDKDKVSNSLTMSTFKSEADNISPVCKGHSEPCKLMQVRKSGSNKGRWFYMCNRPPGGSEPATFIDTAKRYTQYRCDHFEWAEFVKMTIPKRVRR